MAMKSLDIKREINNLVHQLVTKYHAQKIILFGSAVRGRDEMINDLDFLIIKQDVPSRGLDRIRELEHLIERNVPVDMIVYRPDELEERIKLGDPFVKAILKEGRVLYG